MNINKNDSVWRSMETTPNKGVQKSINLDEVSLQYELVFTSYFNSGNPIILIKTNDITPIKTQKHNEKNTPPLSDLRQFKCSGTNRLANPHKNSC